MKGRQAEGRDEQWAREIVSKTLGGPICRFDDGTDNCMVDAVVHYPDRQAALEVVTDHDRKLTEQGAVLHGVKNRIEVSGLRNSWVVTLGREANINKVERVLRKSLPAWQDNPPPPSELYRLGIMSAEQIVTGTVSGRVWLPQGGGSVRRQRVETVGEWVREVLREHHDVPEKLEAHPDVAERHAFIWATPSSERAVHAQLEPGDDHPLPVTAPTLPGGVTHLWVAGFWSPRVLAWFPGRGWWRTPLPWTSDGPALHT